MSNVPTTVIQPKVKRIGILLADVGKLNTTALKFLVLHMNTLQSALEYEILPVDLKDDFIRCLSNDTTTDRAKIKQGIPAFLTRYQEALEEEIQQYQLKEAAISAEYFILVTTARFSDHYYNTRAKELSIMALGNWKRHMAPPSLIEFIVMFILRETLSCASPSLRSSVHLGTRGCICDFTASLDEARLKVLTGYLCHSCRSALQADGLGTSIEVFAHLLKMDWIGIPSEPLTPAGIVANLGYNLFLTKGLKATIWEKFVDALQQEGTQQALNIVGAVIQAIVIPLLILWLGLKK